MFLRNIKKGYATNSSSYHSTIYRVIDVPKEIWIEFKEKGGEFVDTGCGGYSTGIVLKDDEGTEWNNLEEIESYAEYTVAVDEYQHGLETWVRIQFETQD